jgi:hypothetical protein
MLILPIVIRDGIAIDLSNLDKNPTGGIKVCSHNMYYSPSETILVNI